MKFKFNIFLTENDYYEFNVFHQTRSHYGKKSVSSMQAILFILAAVLAVFIIVTGGFTEEAFLSAIPYAAVPIILALLVKPFLKFTLKGTIEGMKKSGKLGYSPESVVEFFEDSFRETTETEVSEKKYATIERVSIVEGGNVYLHTSAVMCLIIPNAAFDSAAERTAFIDFIKTKCATVDYYEK